MFDNIPRVSELKEAQIKLPEFSSKISQRQPTMKPIKTTTIKQKKTSAIKANYGNTMGRKQSEISKPS